MKKIEIKNILNELKNENNYRTLKNFSDDMINFSSNDYLYLANNNSLKDEFYKLYRPNLSSSSSRLITGSTKEVMDFEKKAERIYKKPCITFNSGFDANSSIIETFYNKNSLIITDRLNHASIYDGIINSGAKCVRYRHLDMKHLENILIKYKDLYDDILVVSESIYSMDGDILDLEKICELKRRYNFDLMIDEAHSYGVYGYGMSYNLGLIDDITFLTIPLGKGGASMGAMVILDEIYKDFIINKSRKFIFSTSLPPVNHAWNKFILEKMPEFKNYQEILKNLIEFTNDKLKFYNIPSHANSHIISIVIGDNKRIDKIQKNLRFKNYLVYGVKSPTVPLGTSRFRISLNPSIKHEDIDNFLKELRYELDNTF